MRLELNGTSIASGVGVGRAVLVRAPAGSHQPQRLVQAGEEAAALQLFETAHAKALLRLAEVQAATAKQLGLQDAAIYAAQAAVLRDPVAMRDIRRMILEERFAPESAIQALLDRLVKVFEGLEGGDLKNWAADLRDPWTEVLRELGEGEEDYAIKTVGSGDIVLIAEELTPSVLMRFPRERLAGIACARGGRFSHGAVVARSMGLPTVSGIERIAERVREGESCVVYGDEGRLSVGSEPREIELALRRATERRQLRESLAGSATQPARTADGTELRIQANIESPRDLELFDLASVDGVGLFRTEFAYMERPSFPGVEEQTKLYAAVLERLEGREVTFRTLDVGADKQLRYLQLPKENNPALGMRGLRLGLAWQDILLMQFQSLAAAAPSGAARVMLPMVSTLEEFRAARSLYEALPAPPSGRPPLGAMIEVPSAVMSLRDILREAEFVSVGTNDLTQYLFAVDRDNPWVSSLYQPYHPAHLRMLRGIARVCRSAGRPAAVCGELAGQPAGALFLVGAGFRNLSMAATFVPEIKALLRASDKGELEAAAFQALRCQTAQEAFEVLEAVAEGAWERVVRSHG
ncbi:MAG: phosphoenolpyruvate--protein phosphotransferase [Planctomycetota bacterium]|nr:phosphoenolpyruvate--protein phosphotransferase [Planctomycetota bacterium]